MKTEKRGYRHTKEDREWEVKRHIQRNSDSRKQHNASPFCFFSGNLARFLLLHFVKVQIFVMILYYNLAND